VVSIANEHYFVNLKRTAIELPVSYNTGLADQLRNRVILIKFGGNAMVDESAKQRVIRDIIHLKSLGIRPVVVHGGGPVIKNMLEVAQIESNFVEGHRVTDAEAIDYVEMALSGHVNGDIVSMINRYDARAVGLSGKDGPMVRAKKRFHRQIKEGKTENIDLGYVGDVGSVNTDLIQTLIGENYLPVVSPVSMDAKGDTYNINADMFAGHLAGALQAARYVALTDVHGVMRDPENPSTLIRSITASEAKEEMGDIIKGGMIPKVESGLIALRQGAQSAHIINGLHPNALLEELLTEEGCGTLIRP